MDMNLVIRELEAGILSIDAIKAIGFDVSYYILYDFLSPQAQAITRLKIIEWIEEKVRLEGLYEI